MGYYRSDWPEVGLETAIIRKKPAEQGVRFGEADICIRKREVSKMSVRVVLQRNQFESDFYGFLIHDLRVELTGPDVHLLNKSAENRRLSEAIGQEIRELLASHSPKYAAARCVRGEPLWEALRRLDFEEVERRRLYLCKIGDLAAEKSNHLLEGYEFATLLSEGPDRASRYRKQIFDICNRSFSGRGFTRHFTDPHLVKYRPGIDYIRVVMEQNFRTVPEANFLIAMDKSLGKVSGFTVVGPKLGLEGKMYTQLLSAVREENRGVGIYRGLSWALRKNFPPTAKLLNVTHVENTAMQRAYEGSNRRHLADTVIVRRVLE
jgi:hypothetical protein